MNNNIPLRQQPPKIVREEKTEKVKEMSEIQYTCCEKIRYWCTLIMVFIFASISLTLLDDSLIPDSAREILGYKYVENFMTSELARHRGEEECKHGLLYLSKLLDNEVGLLETVLREKVATKFSNSYNQEMLDRMFLKFVNRALEQKIGIKVRPSYQNRGERYFVSENAYKTDDCLNKEGKAKKMQEDAIRLMTEMIGKRCVETESFQMLEMYRDELSKKLHNKKYPELDAQAFREHFDLACNIDERFKCTNMKVYTKDEPLLSLTCKLKLFLFRKLREHKVTIYGVVVALFVVLFTWMKIKGTSQEAKLTESLYEQVVQHMVNKSRYHCNWIPVSEVYQLYFDKDRMPERVWTAVEKRIEHNVGIINGFETVNGIGQKCWKLSSTFTR